MNFGDERFIQCGHIEDIVVDEHYRRLHLGKMYVLS